MPGRNTVARFLCAQGRLSRRISGAGAAVLLCVSQVGKPGISEIAALIGRERPVLTPVPHDLLRCPHLSHDPGLGVGIGSENEMPDLVGDRAAENRRAGILGSSREPVDAVHVHGREAAHAVRIEQGIPERTALTDVLVGAFESA